MISDKFCETRWISHTQNTIPANICSKSTIETLAKGVKYVEKEQ